MERANFSNIKRGLKDMFPSNGYNIIIHRFVSFTAGDDNGKSPSRKTTDLNMPTQALLRVANQADVLSSNGYYEIGDIVTQTVMDIVGFNSDPQNKAQGDRMTWDGFTYTIKGKPKKVYIAGGRYKTEALWRRA